MVILAVCPSHCQARLGRSADVCEHVRRGHRVIAGRTGHHHDQQPSQGINPNMTLASGDLLAAVIAALAASFGGLHRLAVETGGAWGGRVRGGLLPADVSAPRVQHGLPGTVVVPRREVCLDGAVGQQIVREQIPWAARPVAVEDGVDDFSHVYGPRASAALGERNQRLQDGPLIVCQVRQIRFTSWGSHWGDLRQKCDNSHDCHMLAQSLLFG
jgi:hypothetical protein